MDRKNSGSYKGKYIRRVAGILAAWLIFAGIVHVLNYMYVNSDDTWREHIIWHQFYENDGQIDKLYLGSSHVFYDLDTAILDKLNGQNNFNLASATQLLNGSYYLLREADRRNELQNVYVELYYFCTTKDNFRSDAEGINAEWYKNWWNIDYMKMSSNKLTYMLSITGPDEYVNTLFPFCRYRENLNDGDYIRQVIENRNSDNYVSYEYYYCFDDGNGYDEFQDKGYISSTRRIADASKSFKQTRVLGENPIGEETRKYLYKIIDYCKERDIPITLFISPTSDLDLISTENYDNYIRQVRTIAAERDVPFYDFNLAKEEYLSIQQGEYYRDVGHLNCFGGEMFTSFFHEVVSRDESENKKYFHDSYMERLQDEDPAVYGIYYRDPELWYEEGQVRTLWIASNRDSDMEYRIILTPQSGEQYMVQDFNVNKEFTAPYGEHGTCTIVYRMKELPDEVQTMEIIY